MADVFISYASEDRDRVRPLAETLQKRGLDVWWDRALAAGDDYAGVIARELDAAKAVIVVWSRVSVESPWVRDEAARARDTSRLVPALFDKVQIPLGFGAIQAEDFTAWNGAASAPQIELLEESLRARIEGRAPDGAGIQAKRKKLGARIRLVSILTAIAVAAGGVGGVLTIVNQSKPAPVVVEKPAQDSLSQLLELVNQGKITGDQAVELAKLLQQQAFADIPPPPAEQPTAGAAPADSETKATAALSEPGAAELASISAAQLSDNAKSTFADAAAILLQDPDPEVRMAALKAASPATRQAGMDRLWELAETGSASSPAIWRYCAALGIVTNDPRTEKALERAREGNPQDQRIWKMLGFAYRQQNNLEAARAAALVGDGLEKASSGDDQAAMTQLEQAASLLPAADAKGFVLSQVGDLAAKNNDWRAAEQKYKAAVDIAARAKNIGGIAVSAPKLARAQAQQGDARAACRTLRRAEQQGADTVKTQADEACAQADQAAPTQPAPR